MALNINKGEAWFPEDLKVDTFQFICNLLDRVIPHSHVGIWAKDYINRWFQLDPTCFELGAIPYWAFKSAGGKSGKIVPTLSAWQLLRLSAKLFDDIEDGDTQGTVSFETNRALSILLSSQLALSESVEWGCASQEYSALAQRFNQACMLACEGQQQDLLAQLGEGTGIDPDYWLEMAKKKSGALFAWASWSGAFLADAGPDKLAAYDEIGLQIGILLQIADDYRSIWDPNRRCEFITGSPPLPVIYSLYNATQEEKVVFQRLVGAVLDKKRGAEEAVKQFLRCMGAEKFVYAAACLSYYKIIEASKNIHSSASDTLIPLLNRIMPINFPLDTIPPC